LADWLDGCLDADAAQRVAGLVAGGDERTVGTVQWLRGFLVTARLLPLEEPPPVVRQSLRLYFAWWSGAGVAGRAAVVPRCRGELLAGSGREMVGAGRR
jgi:hypothetical protein